MAGHGVPVGDDTQADDIRPDRRAGRRADLRAAHGLQVGYQGWRAIADTIDWVCEHWDQPDEGIWETRGGRKDFTYGRFQSWVALDRAIRLAQRHGRPQTWTGG